MKIAQLISGLPTMVTNEERGFMNNHPDQLKLTNLNDHELWIAQNLVRKGVYAISKDSNTLTKNDSRTNT
jgi:hypothetical protein